VVTWNATYAPLLMKEPGCEIRERQWRRTFAENDGTWFRFVVERPDGELVGFAKGNKSDHSEFVGELNKIYILREYQALGRRLLGHVVRRFPRASPRCGGAAMPAIRPVVCGGLSAARRSMTIPGPATTAGVMRKLAARGEGGCLRGAEPDLI
jgi:hypothetical protein